MGYKLDIFSLIEVFLPQQFFSNEPSSTLTISEQEIASNY